MTHLPLWYAQEVEDIRRDVRVVNLMYLSTDWYIIAASEATRKLALRHSRPDNNSLALHSICRTKKIC